MKNKFPGFRNCMAMMRSRDPQRQEEGFGWLESNTAEYIHQLIEEFENENDNGIRCWLLELIGSAKSTEALPFLKSQLQNNSRALRRWAIWGLKNLDSKEASTALWEARLLKLSTQQETTDFLMDLDDVLNKQKW